MSSGPSTGGGATEAAARPEPTGHGRDTVSYTIFALARSHRALAARLLRELGLFPGQEITLMLLGSGEGLPQSEIGRALGVDHSTVAKSVARLAEAGFVVRARSPRDGRVTLVSLTPAGRDLLARVDEAWSRLEETTVAPLSEQERATFRRLAAKIAAGLPC